MSTPMDRSEEAIEKVQPEVAPPETVGVVGGVISATLFPVMAAVGAIGAMVAHLTIVLEKRE
nr:DUF4342 domain-containing protein [Chamaesiphon sp. OTE_75_metabat_556]